MELHEAPALYEKIIHYDEAKEIQVRLVVSTFRGIEYLHLRKYYLDFTEEWKPTPEGQVFTIREIEVISNREVIKFYEVGFFNMNIRKNRTINGITVIKGELHSTLYPHDHGNTIPGIIDIDQ